MDSAQFSQFMDMMQQAFQSRSADSRTEAPVGSQTVNTALLPNFESFDSKKESFRANNFNIIAALAAPKTPCELKYDELIKLLDKQLSPKKNVLVAQHQFLSKYQLPQQSIADFVAALRTDMVDCEYVSPCDCNVPIADMFLRAQFIRGIQDNSIREQLLQSEASNFGDIVSRAIALEAAKRDCKELSQKTSTSSPTVDINKVYSNQQNKNRHFQQRSMSNQKSKSKINFKELGIEGLCLRCGRNNHLAKECRTDQSKLKCTGCKKQGHVIRVCINSLVKNKSKSNQSNYIEGTTVNQVKGLRHIVNVYQNRESKAIQRFQARVNIEGKPVVFEVDSGSGYTFIPRDQFENLKLNLPVLPTDVGFRSYTQDIFVPDGKIHVNVEYNGFSIKDEAYIVPEEYAALLGRSWIRKLNINLNDIDKYNTNQLNAHAVKSVCEIDEMTNAYPEIFQQKIGCIPGYKIKLQLREKAQPVFHREREIPYALVERVDQELQALEASGIITKVKYSDWGSPLVVIPKPNGEVRLCVDYKIGVNERIMSSHYPIRKIDEIFNSLRNSRYFCRLDLFKAYLHVPVDENSSKIQTISTHRGTYRMNRLSFGIKTAPSEFNRIIDQILRDVPKTESYFDDIIVHGKSKEECKGNLFKCFNQLQKFDLHLNREKCSFFQERIDFLGHTIENNKISKSSTKVEAIINMKTPTSIDEVKRFLGMVTYYSRFIPNASTLTTPLRQLLMKNKKFDWTKQCEAAFIKLKEEIASDRVLMPFNPELQLQLACDASPTGIAGVLSHLINGYERPIAFASRSLTQAEQNYSQLDREALAIVFAVDHFYQYLFCRPFDLITDNQPLVRIFHQHAKIPRMTSARLQRYAAFLSGFNYKVVFKRGNENVNADCLSRAPIKSNHLRDNTINEEVHQICLESVHRIMNQKLNFEVLQEETVKDETLFKLLQDLRNDINTDCEFTIDDDIVFKGQRVVIPPSLQASVLEELHRTHIGITKMKQLARRYVYWKGIDKDIERLVRACSACALNRNSPPKAPLHPWEEPENNWQRVHIDYAGPFQGYNFLICVDAKSKWSEIEICSAAPTSTSTIELLLDIFSRNGYPDVMVSDNATIFTSEEFQTFCKESGIAQKFIAPGHPATNGLAERNVQTLKRRIKAMSGESVPIRKKVREILFRYRATPLNNGRTPAEQYLQRQIRIQFDALKPVKTLQNSTPARSARQLVVGERVQARYYTNNKLQWRFGTIIKKMGHLHYMIKLDNGYVFKRHIDQLLSNDVQPEEEPLSEVEEVLESNPETKSLDSYLQDLVQIPNYALESQNCSHHEIVQVPEFSNETPEVPNDMSDQQLRTTGRQRRMPAYLNDYIVTNE